MQNRLLFAVLLGVSFASGGAASFSLFEHKPPAQPPTIMVVHEPPQAILRGHGWELTLPAPDDRSPCLRRDNCSDDDSDDDDSDVISI
jgi:hypothetical protein